MLRIKGSAKTQLALAVAVSVVLIVLELLASDRAQAGAVATAPSRIVAVTFDGRLLVLDSQSGRVIRTLARDVVATNGVGGVSVTPDGQRVYFTRQGDAGCDEIASVSI